MKTLLEVILAVGLLINHLVAHGEALKRSFDTAGFVGLVSMDLSSYEQTVLDYALDSPDGRGIQFKNCRQVESTRENEILASHYPLFRLLSMNCLGLKRFIASTEARRSFFPARLTASDIAQFPATAMVPISSFDMAQRAGKTLSQYAGPLHVHVGTDGSINVLAGADDISYRVMARADFDQDGNEDLLVCVNWRARDAMGKGTDLVVLSKTSDAGSTTVSWRP